MNRLEQKEQTRRKLIEAALVLSADRGFSALSLREIAKSSGITATGFYRHFRDLDEMGLALVDEVALALRQLIREARRRYGQDGRVKSSVEAFVEYVHGKPHLFRLLLGERLGGSSEFRKALHREIDGFVSELGDDLEAGANEVAASLGKGRVTKSAVDFSLAAEAIVAIVFSVGAEALELPRHRLPGLCERIIREVYMVLRGAGLETRNDPLLAAAPEENTARPLGKAKGAAAKKPR